MPTCGGVASSESNDDCGCGCFVVAVVVVAVVEVSECPSTRQQRIHTLISVEERIQPPLIPCSLLFVGVVVVAVLGAACQPPVRTILSNMLLK